MDSICSSKSAAVVKDFWIFLRNSFLRKGRERFHIRKQVSLIRSRSITLPQADRFLSRIFRESMRISIRFFRISDSGSGFALNA